MQPMPLYVGAIRLPGNSAEAVYARGSLAIREKDYKMAVLHLEKAREMGLQMAEITLAELTKRGYTE